MRLAIPVAAMMLLQGCSTIQDWAGSPVNSDDECSLNSVPICIPIGGQKMGNIENYVDGSSHFKIKDFACKCGKCGGIVYTPSLVRLLDDIQERFDRDVIVTSGYRCKEHNKAVGGIENSAHVLGTAVDFVVRGVSPAKVVQYLADWEGSVGEYTRHVHIEVGEKKRWKGEYASS